MSGDLLSTINTGMSGLMAYSQGLQDIGNNLTNVNTPGYKGTETQFSDLFDQANGEENAGGGAQQQVGAGLTTVGSNIDFTQGTLNPTGNPLDVAISGDGFFVTLNGAQQTYTRAGQFQFNSAGILINEANGQQVAGIASNGQLSNISLASLHTSPAKATTTIPLTGALSNTYATTVPPGSAPSVPGITVYDPAGGQHTLTISFSLVTPAATAGTDVWNVTAKDGTGATVGTGSISYTNGTPVTGSDTLNLSYAPSGVTAFPIKLDFSGTSSSAIGATSSISAGTVDGNSSGTLTSETFDSTGMLVATYSNGQTVNGPHLAMAYFNSSQELTETSGNNFVANNQSDAKFGIAGTGSLGSVTAGSIEGSNVNLSQEFSNLIVMQRGYQAASQVLSTANDMIQTLFDMKKE
jgi:flagellar hook protein FlgE